MKTIGVGSLLGIFLCFIVFTFLINPKSEGGIALLIIVCFGISYLIINIGTLILNILKKRINHEK